MTSIKDLEASLLARVQKGTHGDRLPPVRDLMREYGVGQAAMQSVLGHLARQGMLSLEVGRGTFIQRPGHNERPALRGARFLLLSPRVQTERSYQVARRVHGELDAEGAVCVHMVYARIEEAMALLKPNLRFDACILQSYFDTVPLALLAFLRERCTAVVADGARLTGVNVDAVASDWRGAMDIGLAHLRAQGHQQIGFLAWPGNVQPLLGLRQHFNSLRLCLGLSQQEMPLIELEHMPQPGESSAQLIGNALAPVLHVRSKRPSALLAWVGSDAQSLQEALAQLCPSPRTRPQVLALGHVNRWEDHLGKFTVVGSNSDAAANALVQLARERMERPRDPQRTIQLANQLVKF